MKCLIVFSLLCILQGFASSSPIQVGEPEKKKEDLIPQVEIKKDIPQISSVQVEQPEEKKDLLQIPSDQILPVEAKKDLLQLPSIPISHVLEEQKDIPVISPIKKVHVPAIPSVHQIDDQQVDPSFALSDPIDTATKLLIDLEEHVLKFLPSEVPEEVVPLEAETTTSAPSPPSPPIYIGAEVDGIDLASIVKQSTPVNQQQTMNTLLEQLDVLQTSISDTINQLTTRRRYVMAAMLRPLSTYVRRVRSNLERLQNRITSLQTFATAGPGAAAGPPVGAAPIDQGVLASIRRQVEQIQKQIAGIVNRISQSLSLPPPFTGLGSTAPSTS